MYKSLVFSMLSITALQSGRHGCRLLVLLLHAQRHTATSAAHWLSPKIKLVVSLWFILQNIISVVSFNL